MKSTIDIVIPTYNRKEYLIKNLTNIISYISILELTERIGIIVSDNCSDDGTNRAVSELKKGTKAKLTFYRQSKNIGGVNNIKFLVGISSADYLLLLGDDDFFSLEYLRSVVQYLDSNEKITTIIPNCYNTLTYKYRTPLGKDEVFDYPDSLRLVFHATQMSGIVFKREGLEHEMEKNPSDNLYLQMFFVGFSARKGKTIHILSNPLRITIPEKRRWNYSKDMLLSDMFENLIMLQEPFRRRAYYEMVIIEYNAKNYISQGIKRVLSIWNGIIESKKLTALSKFFFPLYLCIGIIKGTVRRTRFILDRDKTKYMAEIR